MAPTYADPGLLTLPFTFFLVSGDYSDDGSPLPETTSGGFMDSDWLILSILCGLLLIFVVIASAAVIILICRKIKSSDHKSLRRNRNQVYKG